MGRQSLFNSELVGLELHVAINQINAVVTSKKALESRVLSGRFLVTI